MRGRVGQRADGLQQLDDRAGPAVRHDQRQRVLMPRPDVDEVDLDPVDLGRELRQRIQSRLALAPVVPGRPVAGELLQRRQLHALRPIFDQLLVGQRVAAIRRRRSSSASSGMSTLKGPISVAVSTVLMTISFASAVSGTRRGAPR